MSNRRNFSFKVRQATLVAYTVAAEVNENTRFPNRAFGQRHEVEILPSLESINDSTNGTIFRYVGGTVVIVRMIDLGQFTIPTSGQYWCVTNVDIRYFAVDEYYVPLSGKKRSETWDHNKLAKLQEVRHWWHHPDVIDPEIIAEEIRNLKFAQELKD